MQLCEIINTKQKHCWLCLGNSYCMQLHLQLPFLFNCSHKTLRDVDSRKRSARSFALAHDSLFFFVLAPCNQQMCMEIDTFRCMKTLYLMASKAFFPSRSFPSKAVMNYNPAIWSEFHTRGKCFLKLKSNRKVSRSRAISMLILIASYAFEIVLLRNIALHRIGFTTFLCLF
jgi:hypothetical protein